MPLNEDISTALQLLEHIQHTIDVSDDAKLQAQTSNDLNLLISVLENPILRGIISVQVWSMQALCIVLKLHCV
jgi:multiple PDZ domain protein